MAITNYWINQLVVCVDDRYGLEFGKDYKIESIINTPLGQAFYLHGIKNTVYLINMFIPKLRYIEITQYLNKTLHELWD